VVAVAETAQVLVRLGSGEHALAEDCGFHAADAGAVLQHCDDNTALCLTLRETRNAVAVSQECAKGTSWSVSRCRYFLARGSTVGIRLSPIGGFPLQCRYG